MERRVIINAESTSYRSSSPKTKIRPPRGRHGDMIHGWNSQLPPVSHMDGERREWNRVNELANVSSHTKGFRRQR
jgi:hypothetical protein